ncbi:IS200/IS605 family transposase [Streptomyces mirabilis]|uniref:IS200/IS605 family transposase n=1 Tax=Streptomyces mirabilis TaxID=68239 RepID=UPI00368027BA
MTAKVHAWVVGEMQTIRTGRHCVFLMYVYLVFVTRFRNKVFTDAHLTRMEEIMRSVCADFACERVEFNGEDDPVHLVVDFPPEVAVTRLIRFTHRAEVPDLYWS